MACEACNAKFSFFTRKKQCVDCLRHFCSECVIKRLDKILNCDTCNMLSRRPLTRTLIAQMRSKDIRQYLLAKKISIEGCIEKEDLIKLLIAFANGTNVYQDTEDTRNVDYSPSNESATNYEHSAQILNRVQELNTARVASDSEIPETVSTIDLCSDEAADPVRSDEKMISTISNIQRSDVLVETSTNPVKLSDITTLSELERLSVKQLKNLLSTNRVDYKGCVERYELLNRASRLWEEYTHSRRTKMDENLDENLCKICWDEPIECVILECGHMACCLNCGKQMSECPICKQYVVRVVRFFKA